MLRITFGGKGLIGFPVDQQGASIKLLLPHLHQSWEEYLESLKGLGIKPLKRTYTIVNFSEKANELVVEVAQHSPSGPATTWAKNVEVGDEIGILGPGRLRIINSEAKWYFIAGDMSALPAISAQIPHLPESATGYILIEVSAEDDRRRWDLPPGIVLQWRIGSSSSNQFDNFSEFCKSIVEIPSDLLKERGIATGMHSVWIAGEASMVVSLRNWVANELQIDKSDRHMSGYWKLDCDEDSYQDVKRRDFMD